MSDNCQSFREALFGLGGDLEPRAGVEAPDERLARHLELCPDCATLHGRLEAQRRLLKTCAIVPAPRELEGRVVAALETGHRQDRAAQVVKSLEPFAAPAVLTGRLEGVDFDIRPALGRALAGGDSAPAVLERLVAEEIADPARTRTRRSMEFLRRRRAPSALDARIARLFTPFARLRHVARPMGLAAAAALVVLFVVPVLRPGREPATPTYSFRVVRGSSVRDLDPQARRLLDGLTGGALFLNGEAR